MFLGVTSVLWTGQNPPSTFPTISREPPLDASSKKLIWSYKSTLILERATNVGTGAQALPANSGRVPIILSSAPSSSAMKSTTISSLGTTAEVTKSPLPEPSTTTSLISSAVLDASTSFLPMSLSESTASIDVNFPSSSASSIDVPDLGITSTISSPTTVKSSNVEPIISVATIDGQALTYSATFILTAASLTAIQTATETESSGIVGIIMFPGTEGRSWKFPCLISCDGGFSTSSLGPPPGVGPLSESSGGGGGGGGGGDGGGGGGGGSGGGGGGGSGGGGSDGGGGGANQSNPDQKDNDNGNESAANLAHALLDCASTPSSTSIPPATGTQTGDSEATLWTITIVTNEFINPAYTFDSALAYAAMQSIDNDQKTLRLSGLITKTSTSSSTATSSVQDSILGSSSASMLKLSSVDTQTSASSSTSNPAPTSTSKHSSLNTPPPISTPQSSKPPVSPSPTPSKVPTTTSAPPPHDTAATYIDCSPIGCVGIKREDAIESIKSFCSHPAVINSATPTAILSFDFEGSKVRPTPVSGSLKDNLIIAIEQDTDPRCAEAEHKVSPPRGYQGNIVTGADGKCVKMLQSTLDNCNTDTVAGKLGGTVTTNCFAWSIFTGNTHGNC
ncbi:hypothetical protein IFR04_004157 [Cadophora malorum]|uniref:Uncharacterized protein n=1 Tax=Cadophora malorum TaxID=108018 RepID=A0A8H8BSY5_9HELO|nr:hypothetical protein IFR04_004157 [Cadophora malorum]